MGSPVPRSAVLGIGSYVPERRLTNADLAKIVDTNDDWIVSRTGIRERRIAADGQVTSDLCVAAARPALEMAGLAPADLDLIVVATLTPDVPMPATACSVQRKLGARTVGAFDLSAACSGFLYGMGVADQFVRAGGARHVLVIGAEILSRVVDYKDRGTCVLFGDGAGAAVIGPSRGEREILSVRLCADGVGVPKLCIPAGGSARPASHETVDERMHYVKLEGKEVYRFAIVATVEMIGEAMKAHDLTPEDIGAVVPHQANIRIIDAARERLPIPREKYVLNLSEYGNTSAASVPIALDEAHRQGRLPRGKHVILAAFGGGLTWGSAVLRW